jgi:hypothetical protein
MITLRIQATYVNIVKTCSENTYTYSSGIWHPVVFYIGTKKSDEPAAFIFRINEYIYPEDRGVKFFQNVGSYLPNDMASHAKYCKINFILGAGW